VLRQLAGQLVRTSQYFSISLAPKRWRRNGSTEMSCSVQTGPAGNAELALSFLVVAVTVVNTHSAYPWRDGQAELTWVAWLNTKTVQSPISVLTHIAWLCWCNQQCYYKEKNKNTTVCISWFNDDCNLQLRIIIRITVKSLAVFNHFLVWKWLNSRTLHKSNQFSTTSNTTESSQMLPN